MDVSSTFSFHLLFLPTGAVVDILEQNSPGEKKTSHVCVRGREGGYTRLDYVMYVIIQP